ncbi:MAG: ferredoxin [Desulfovibrio sp.]|nr:ferredoxin [Desulfovibrio sp.]
MKQATVDQQECVGCGACAEIDPEVFRINDDDKAEAYGKVTDANEESTQEAIDTCPVSAISWED